MGTVVTKSDQGVLGETLRVRVDKLLLRRIGAVCRATGRKRSEVVRLLMVAGLEKHEGDASRHV